MVDGVGVELTLIPLGRLGKRGLDRVGTEGDSDGSLRVVRFDLSDLIIYILPHPILPSDQHLHGDSISSTCYDGRPPSLVPRYVFM